MSTNSIHGLRPWLHSRGAARLIPPKIPSYLPFEPAVDEERRIVVSTQHRCRQLVAPSHFFPVGKVVILTRDPFRMFLPLRVSYCSAPSGSFLMKDSGQSPLKLLVKKGLNFRRESISVRCEALGSVAYSAHSVKQRVFKALQREGLLQVSRVCSNDLSLDIVLAGENDDRDGSQVRVAVPFLKERPAIHNGHHEVQQDAARVPRCATQILESFGPVCSQDYVVTVFLEELSKRFARIGIIIHHQDNRHRRDLAGLGCVRVQCSPSVFDWFCWNGTFSPRPGQRQGEREGASHAFLTFDPNTAIMSFDDAPDDGESEAGSLTSPLAGPREAVEDVRQIRLWNPAARIGHRKATLAGEAFDSNLD